MLEAPAEPAHQPASRPPVSRGPQPGRSRRLPHRHAGGGRNGYHI